MKSKKKYIALTVALFASLIVFTACKHDSNRTGFVFDYVSEVLDLTEAQQEKLNGIKDDLGVKVEQMHEDKEALHATLKTQLTSEVIDKEVLRQLVAEHRARMDSVLDLAIDRLADFHADLTPEQRTKLVDKLEKFGKRHH